MKEKLAIAASILNKVKLPKISNEVAALQNESLKPEPDINTIVQCINRNPKLFTKFLAVASFMAKKEVTTARQAVDILGTKGVFTVFFSSAIEFSFQSKGDSVIIVNHAIKIATAMVELSRKLKGFNSSDAYLYGLLYNVGYIVLSQYSPEKYKSCYLASLMAPSECAEKELKAFRTTSAHIGIYVAKKWHVKNSVYGGILFQQQDIQKCPKGENHAYELINLLNIARMVVSETEDSRYVTDEIRESAKISMQRLGIGNLHYIKAQQKVKQLGKDLRSIPEELSGNEEIQFAMK
ncbi:HDOD domain-containing protein [Thiomicrorhabdus sp. Kp2]|uniref:HDOD domain-containing protein n=1 Tax=Thiomicrorhabdus sp. Kp2 TaxID=1123518 RepID=UPI0003F5C53C|nr:HDOD domain-containing protein [Thiomicrorhabdus sp. Kp2]